MNLMNEQLVSQLVGIFAVSREVLHKVYKGLVNNFNNVSPNLEDPRSLHHCQVHFHIAYWLLIFQRNRDSTKKYTTSHIALEI